MGSLYRSQHELLPLFKKGAASNVNNISLGKRGRHRTNLWTYPGASSLGSDTRKGLQDHPTVKPTAMLQDALIDLTNRGEIVLDPFLGSGSTLIAAENTGRVCCGIELDPLYVDVIIRRYEAETGAAVILADSGETFEKVAARRRHDQSERTPLIFAGKHLINPRNCSVIAIVSQRASGVWFEGSQQKRIEPSEISCRTNQIESSPS